jgi:hypothetical protein
VQHKLAADPRKIGDVLPMESGAPL